jgi:predicted Ser/Thr protein kinase
VEKVPQRMGPYEIRGKIGSGGMGVVYLGWDARLNRQVAIKTLWPALAENEEARERFLREARAAAAISHPNVTQIYDIGEDDGRVYFAMEYLDGKSLQGLLIERGELPPAEVISLARQAASGLKAAAERGIIHRDIKPSNLVVNSAGTLKVTDFGLAKQQVTDSSLTMEGQFIGTPDYISPEQAQGGALDLRSDIYSLGATLFEMLGGRPPFIGTTPVSVVVQHLREPVPSLRHVNPDVPFQLAALIQRMLAKRPGGRPQDYDQLINQLDRIETSDAPAFAPGAAAQGSSTPVVTIADADSGPGFASRLFVFSFLALVLLVGAGLLLRRDGAKAEPTTSLQEPAGASGAVAAAPEQPSPARPAPLADGGASPSPLGQLLKVGRAELQFVDATQEITDDGRLRVAGKVSNTGDGIASRVKVRVALTDETGQVLESTEVLVAPSRLGAGESGSYEAYFPSPPPRVQVRLEMNWFS